MQIIEYSYKTFIKYKNTVLFSIHNLSKDTSYLIYFLLSIIILTLLVPTILFQSPSGSDVYTHMYYTSKMAMSESLNDFYVKTSDAKQSSELGYPIGLWLFGSIIIKITGMGINELAYIIPFILSIIFILIYFQYSHYLLKSRNEAIFATIFLISMPLLSLGWLSYVTRDLSSFFLIIIFILLIKTKFISQNILIISALSFSLIFTHTGTFIFLLFFSVMYFFLWALIWKKFDNSMYIHIVILLFLYVMAVQLLPDMLPQYIDKGRTVLSTSESISSWFRLEFIKEIGKIFYDSIIVAHNLIFVAFCSSLIFAIGKLLIFFHSKVGSLEQENLLAIPLIGSIKNISHGIITSPFWLGPIHSLLSIVGIFKTDAKTKCIALSLFLTSFLPGAIGPEEGTGALRELYYLYLIIPITSTIGLYYIINMTNKTNKIFSFLLFLILMLPIISMPIIGNLYYQPTISGTNNEKENLIWLSGIGSPDEGVPGFAFRERIDLYAKKLTPIIPSGNEMRRYLNDLRNIYFSKGSEGYTKDLYSFNIKYIISSDRTLKGFGEQKESLIIDSNQQLDKIYSSDDNFGIYKIIYLSAVSNSSSSMKYGFEFEDNSPKIQNLGSMSLVENNFYKVKLSETSPEIKYIGTKTENLLEDGVFFDYIRISWRGGSKDMVAGYGLNEIKYQKIIKNDNEIIYKTILRDQTENNNWATLIVKYTFYEKAIKKEITIANDWLSFNDNAQMDLARFSQIFSPATDFEINQIGPDNEKEIFKKIYPSQDAVILNDKKFNEMYLNESGTGLFIKYSDLIPYPSRISYQGSTMYQYGAVSVDSNLYLSPSESINFIEYLSVGDKSTARKNIEQYTSISPYMYPQGKIPVILNGIKNKGDSTGYPTNIYKKFQEDNVTYNEAITNETKILLRKEVNPVGTVILYNTKKKNFENPDIQNETIKNIKLLGINGILSFQYNLDTIKILSDNDMIFAESLSVPSPFMEFFREGMRHPKIAYYKGEKTGVVLIPVTLPSSASLSHENNAEEVEDLFSKWEETITTIVDDGGISVFLWSAEDIGDPNYIDKFMELINYSKSNGMDFVTPDAIAAHFKLLDKISAKATKGIDYVILNASNHNLEDIKGLTYRVDLPVFGNSCPYSAVNTSISRQEIKEGICRLYISFDLKSGEKKEVKIEPYITRKVFDLDFSNVVEGSSIIKVKDEEGNSVNDADIYVDSRRFESDNNGTVRLMINSGLRRIRVEKPGFVSKDYEINVKSKIDKIISLVIG